MIPQAGSMWGDWLLLAVAVVGVYVVMTWG